jgi:hypothetical protein
MGWDAQLGGIRVSLSKSVLRVRQVFAEGGVLKEYGFARGFAFGSSGIRLGFAGGLGLGLTGVGHWARSSTTVLILCTTIRVLLVYYQTTKHYSTDTLN